MFLTVATGRIVPRRPLLAVHSLRAADDTLCAEKCGSPLLAYHPTFIPLFCSSSHFFRGAKYSRIALASAWRWPVTTCIASGQGLLWPISSILLNFAPASFDPKKVQRLSGPVCPASRQSAR